ncbi:Mg2+ transporter protein, CorA-like protein [Neobacillus notoginsengisoli]|uniref:Mg2+ transporter protein, CorA-like protein n=1 Tax=Neobacillus notoginsengisoli TaxID=1578198 RepID=A0A417YVU3_9BACI|nr:magnesium transporter CorA family protein [Neobacillus notoginsengisoli]RHW41543.1 Mg2+ transporter protein, CorA-like protein [Neobacillus notoginsengisoli]
MFKVVALLRPDGKWQSMNHVFKSGAWEWHEFLPGETEGLKKLAMERGSYNINSWIKKSAEMNTNSVVIDTFYKGAEWIAGSLVFKQDLVEKDDNHVFHFFLAEKFMITSDLDFSVLGERDYNLMRIQMGNCENAIEGFSVLLGEITTSSLIEIDPFEVRLNDLFWKMKKENSTSILEEIYQCRHELLVLKHLMIPLKEIRIGMEEAFGNIAAEKPEYKRTCLKIDRGFAVINEYQAEIDTLIKLEEVVSTHRGNEIMKTLTVLTTLFTPITALGALWGMNFVNMPELEWKYGYVFALGLTALSTIGLYIVLRTKGWSGDILRGKKRYSFFK